MVVAKDKYWRSAADKLGPMDLTIVWGELTYPEYYKKFKFGHGSRYGVITYYPDGVNHLSGQYINEHLSNNHLIFTDKATYKTAKDVRVGDIVMIEGYLVDVYGKRSDGRRLTWSTSTTRSDVNDGACEIIYVENIMVLDSYRR
ncbi:MAG: hypothetical protein SVM80_07035 [Halobacteriota archaeon]|nr:hypothetical protein [Halobacteriota archaeon]